MIKVLSFGSASSMAQSGERPKRGTNPIDSYLVSDIERINLSIGNMTLTLPLATLLEPEAELWQNFSWSHGAFGNGVQIINKLHHPRDREALDSRKGTSPS